MLINILYFRLGQGKDYIYEYQGAFIGRKEKDVLNATNFQKTRYNIQTVADIFPKYYIIRVGSFKPQKTLDPLDEWMYFLKNSEIKQDFKAKGMERAKTVLNFEGMSDKNKAAYKRHIENRRVEMSVTDTAEEKGKRLRSIEMAKDMLVANMDFALIAQFAKLTIDEIEKIAQGEDIMENYI